MAEKELQQDISWAELYINEKILDMKKAIVRRMIAEGELSLDIIARYVDLPIKEVQKLAEYEMNKEEYLKKWKLDMQFEIIKNLMKSTNLTVEQVMEAMKMSDDDREALRKRL